MRLLLALAATGLLAASSVAAQPAGRPLSPSALSGLIKDGQAWCSEWRQSDQSCEEVIFVEAGANGLVSQTRRYLIAERGEVELVVRQSVKLEADGLCWTYKFLDLDVAFLNAGERAPSEQAAALLVLLRERMADLEGKRTCERISRDAATGDLLSTTTVGGEAAPEFNSRLRVLSPDEKVKLRPIFEFDDEPATT